MNLPLPVTYGFRVLARLEPGVELAAARAEVATIGRRLAALEGRSDGTLRVVRLRDELVGDLRPVLLILGVAVAVLLLVTCTNTANLLLVQLVARHREIAVKSAVGATRAHLTRQLLVEGLLLSLLAAGVGAGVVAAGLRLLAALPPAQLAGVREVTIDGRVALFLVLVAAASGLLLAIGPARHGASTDVAAALRGLGGGATGRGGPLRVLVVAEIALTLVLLIGAALLVRSVLALMRHDLGFEPASVLTGKLVLTGPRYATARGQARFLEAVRREVGDLPQVRRASFTNSLPFETGALNLPLLVEGRAAPDPADWPTADCAMVSPGYFETLGIRRVRGRFFSSRDREGASAVVVLDEQTSRRLFGPQNPIGKRVQLFGTWREVVGVVGTVEMEGFRQEARPMAYVPSAQFPLPWPFHYLIVQTRGSPLRALPAVRSAITEVAPEQPLSSVGTLSGRVVQAMARERAVASLLGGFAAFCLALAVTGTYTVVTFSLQQRTREIGIRAALGANRRALFWLILREGAGLTGLGALAGLSAALIATGLLSSLLYGIEAADPTSFLLSTALVGAVTLGAALVPARRVLRLDLAEVLRAEV
jgi:predicted permease